MISLSQTHKRREAELALKLDNCLGVEQIERQACEWIDDISANYISQADFVYSRQATNSLVDVAKRAFGSMRAVNRATWRYALPADKRPGLTKRDVIKYIPGALMIVAAIICLISGMTTACLTALLAAAASAFISTAVKDRPPVEAAPVVNKDEIITCLSRVFEDIDAKLAESMNDVIPDAPRLTRGVIEGVQMLMEARITSDGDYALKSVPQMVDSLRRQGISLEVYTPDTKADFDLLPSLNQSATIRPAVRQGDKLLLRGQATGRVTKRLQEGEKA